MKSSQPENKELWKVLFILEIYFQNKIKAPRLGFKIVALIFKILNSIAFILAVILCFSY